MAAGPVRLRKDRFETCDTEPGCLLITFQSVQQKCCFDLRYGFWVVMGGFVVDTSKIHDTYPRLTLTPQGVVLLAREGLFLEVPGETFAGRSKANILAKSLVVIQVSWMFVQCIARKAADYPLALLEIHTMVHVLCALGIYCLWWHVSNPPVLGLQ